MKRAIVTLTISVLLLSAAALVEAGQEPAAPTLADVAKAEDARRKVVRKPAKVYTNGNLKADHRSAEPATPAGPVVPSTTSPAVPVAPSTTVPVVNLPGGEASGPPPAVRDQAYWRGKMTAALEGVDRARLLVQALQSRINALNTDFVNRDDPAQRAKIDADRKAALSELGRVNKEMETQQKAIAAVEDEARRAGVPSGWLR